MYIGDLVAGVLWNVFSLFVVLCDYCRRDLTEIDFVSIHCVMCTRVLLVFYIFFCILFLCRLAKTLNTK